MEFWKADVRAVLRELETSKKGLTDKEARSRLLKFGRNELHVEQRRTALRIFLAQFESPLVLILIAASAISGFLGDVTSTVIIVGIVFFSAGLAFHQEYKSERAINDLRRRVSLKAFVVRGGRRELVDAGNLVVGDIVILELGKVVPADLRLLSTDSLAMDESILTGESFPAEKTERPIAVERYLPQAMTNLAFMGTHVVQGAATGVVFAVAKATELGKTAHLLEKKVGETEFQRGIREFGNMLTRVILIFSVAVFLFLAIARGDWIGSLLFSLAIAVGISPELLPVIITINLSQGAKKMAAKNVIVKRLMSIEDLGNIDVLCTDKTGTLTEGKIVLHGAHDLSDRNDRDVLKLGWLCNSVTAAKTADGNPLDRAIAEAGKAAGIERDVKGVRLVRTIPFDFTRRRMSVVTEQGGVRTLICKGATEEMLSVCRKDARHERLVAKFDDLHRRGLRLLLVAMKRVHVQDAYGVADEHDLTLVGYLAFVDTPKATARETMPLLKELGVEMKILTGDHALAAQFVCQEIGFEVKGVALGSDLDRLSDAELKKTVERVNLFARITPEHKFRIINALKARGHTVGFLGDGVNDAPALRAADVGISVEGAIDVAKEAADVVLLRKSLGVLTDGILEGRKTFGNTLKYIFATINSNYGNMFSLAGAALILPYIPMLPTQVLLLNFFSDLPMVAVSTDRVDVEYLRKPKHWDIKVISRFMRQFGIVSSLFDFMTFGAMLWIFKANASLFQTGWFWESFLTEVIIIFVVRTKKWFWKSRPSLPLLLTSVITILLVLLVIYTPIGAFFHFTPLPLSALFTIIGITLLYFFFVEIRKKIFYRKYGI